MGESFLRGDQDSPGCSKHVICGKILPKRPFCNGGYEEVSFSVDIINELFGLPNEMEKYPGHMLNNEPSQGLTKKILKTIAWLEAKWEQTLTGRLWLYTH